MYNFNYNKIYLAYMKHKNLDDNYKLQMKIKECNRRKQWYKNKISLMI